MPQVVGQTRHRLPPGSLGFAFWIFFAKNIKDLFTFHINKLSNKWWVIKKRYARPRPSLFCKVHQLVLHSVIPYDKQHGVPSFNSGSCNSVGRQQQCLHRPFFAGIQ